MRNRGLLFLIAIWFLGCSNPEPKKEMVITPSNPGKELNVAFLIVDGVFNSELVAPYDIFQHTIFHTDPGMKVFTVAPNRDTVTTFEGLRILPDYGYLTDSLPGIDVLVVPSAEHSMDSDLEDEKLIEFVSETGKNASYV
ncbi:MAG: DJ-1/PfpI family protein, partial [bacterium]|nr:DJ-1/PfpI family protein [bacterium]